MADLDLHPGVHVALARTRMDEAQLARAIAAGELASPQQYGNSWYFSLRITGTGRAYRQSLDEFVWRDPSLYLNQGFIDRCAGLPVVIEHPKKNMLDSKEYARRNVGSIVFAYILGDEVWGIARIINQPVGRYMAENELSTSPAVVFRPGTNETIEVGDGKHLLIEGKPSLLDHLAICEEGVWDKGGPPAGVDLTSNQEADMADEKTAEELERKDAEDEKEREEEERADADAGEKLDKLLKGIEVLSDRMDAIEARHGRRDASAKEEEDQAKTLEKLAEEEHKEAEEARGDKEEGEEEKEAEVTDRKDDEDGMPWEETAREEGETDSAYSKRIDALAKKHDARYAKRDDESMAAHCDRVAAAGRKDAARRDAKRRLDRVDAIADAVGNLSGRLDRFAHVIEDREEVDEAKFADAQARADDVYQAFGDSAPRPLRGENLIGYRIRLLRKIQKHSAAWKDSDLGSLARADSAAFDNAERMIYADAAAEARKPTGVDLGQLRQVTRRRPGGGEMTEFVGHPLSWMASFMPPLRTTSRLRPPSR